MFKKQNGYSIDGFGNPLGEDNNNNSSTNDVSNPNNLMLKKKQITSIKKKDDTHRMAEANKAFAHFR